MEKIEKNVSFVNAVKETCRTLNIFETLKFQNIFRTLWHLLLLSFICSALIIILGEKNFMNKLQLPLSIFKQQTGGLMMDDSGIFPKKGKNKPLDFKIDNDIKICYFPNAKSFTPAVLPVQGYTILWFPQGAFVYIQQAGQLESTIYFHAFSNREMSNDKLQNAGDLTSYIKNRLNNQPKFDKQGIILPTENSMIHTFRGLLLFYFWFGLFWQCIVLNLVFASFFTLISLVRGKIMTWRETFTVGVYAGFPPMLVACFFPILDLPLFNLMSAFSFGWVIYLLFILNKLFKQAADSANTQ